MTFQRLIAQAIEPVPQRRQDYGKSLRILAPQATLTKPLSECDDWTDLMPPSPVAKPNRWSPALAMERLGLVQAAWPAGRNDTCHGLISGREVSLRPNAPFPLVVFFHELGHFVLGHSFKRASRRDCDSMQEIMAETVAFAMTAMVGAVTYDSLSVSWFYLANWSQGLDLADELTPERIADVNSGIDKVWRSGW
ncbi:MAG: hypothetical protein V9G04_09955 [Nocardioides sp.]|jgi:hypothetical protein